MRRITATALLGLFALSALGLQVAHDHDIGGETATCLSCHLSDSPAALAEIPATEPAGEAWQALGPKPRPLLRSATRLYAAPKTSPPAA